mgnify:CR=1 FL=1
MTIAERILTVLGKKFEPSLFSNMCKATVLKEAMEDTDVIVLLDGYVEVEPDVLALWVACRAPSAP